MPEGDEPESPNAWIRDLINEHLPEGDFRVGEVADEIWEAAKDRLATRQAWLESLGRSAIREAVQFAVKSRRGRFTARIKAASWGGAAQEYHRTGDESVFSVFTVHFAVDEHNTQRAIGDMTGRDHQFLAARAESRGKYDLLRANFHRRIADQIGFRKTSEVMSEDDYTKLYLAIVGEKPEILTVPSSA